MKKIKTGPFTMEIIPDSDNLKGFDERVLFASDFRSEEDARKEAVACIDKFVKGKQESGEWEEARIVYHDDDDNNITRVITKGEEYLFGYHIAQGNYGLYDLTVAHRVKK